MGGGSGAGDADQKLRVFVCTASRRTARPSASAPGASGRLKRRSTLCSSTRRTMRRGRSETTTRPRLEPRRRRGPRAWWLVEENAAASVAATRAARDDDDDGDDDSAPTTSSSAAPVRPVQSRQMRGWDDAAAVIADAVETFGPFDGVLGFSQGASAAALALALVPSLRDTVRFAVLFSGFEPMDPAATAALHAARIAARSMHARPRGQDGVRGGQALAKSFAVPSSSFTRADRCRSAKNSRRAQIVRARHVPARRRRHSWRRVSPSRLSSRSSSSE